MNYKYKVDEGKEHIWTLVVGNPAVQLSDGSKFRVIIEDIYNGTWVEGLSTYKGTILNYSLEVYSTFNSDPIWELASNGSAIFFNESTWDFFLDFDTDLNIALLGWLFIIPIPLNLTWIGDYLSQTSMILLDDYSISGNTLTMQNITSNIDFAYTFNNNGTLTEYKVSSGDQIFYHLKYGDISIPKSQIPLGNYFFLFIPSTIIIIITYTKRKIKYKNN
jgi:hypothetical protein